jgi:predicted esterase
MKVILLCLLPLSLFVSSMHANKILCLHGGGGSGASFQFQPGMQDLIEALPNWDFVFATSPMLRGVWYNDPPGGDKEPTNDPNWANDAINYLDNLIESAGPFDAILGYSQGVPMSLVYIATENYSFDKVLLFNGYLPTTHNGLMSRINAYALYQEETLIFLAENDYLYQIGLEIKTKFSNYIELISATAEHALPTTSDSQFQAVVDFLSSSDSSQSFRLNIYQGSGLSEMNLMDSRVIQAPTNDQFFKAEIIVSE